MSSSDAGSGVADVPPLDDPIPPGPPGSSEPPGGGGWNGSDGPVSNPVNGFVGVTTVATGATRGGAAGPGTPVCGGLGAGAGRTAFGCAARGLLGAEAATASGVRCASVINRHNPPMAMSGPPTSDDPYRWRSAPLPHGVHGRRPSP